MKIWNRIKRGRKTSIWRYHMYRLAMEITNTYVRICKLRDIARSLMRTTHNAYLCKICSTGFLLPRSSFCSSFCIIWKASQVVASTIMYCNQYYSAPWTCFYASRCIAAQAQVSFSARADVTIRRETIASRRIFSNKFPIFLRIVIFRLRFIFEM